jgi:ketosteroid isomerase-like protein
MRVLSMMTVVVLVAAASRAGAQGAQTTAPGDSDIATIRDKENVWAEAIVERDSSGLAPMLAAEYVEVANAGRPAVTRAQSLHAVGHPADSTQHYSRITFDELRIRMTARDRAVAEGSVTEVGTNSKGPITDRLRFVDTWVRRDHRWVCVSSKFTPVPVAKKSS